MTDIDHIVNGAGPALLLIDVVAAR